MKKSLFIAFALVAVCAVSVSANFKEGELPVSAMVADTAYTLKGGTWLIEESFPNVALPITYGIIDGLQVGTKFLLWIPQWPNVNVKWNFLKDEGGVPAITLGGEVIGFSNLDTLDKPTLVYFNLTAYVSKMVAPKLYLSGSYTYNNAASSKSLVGSGHEVVKFFKTLSGGDEPGPFSNAALAVIYQMADNTRFNVDSVFFIGDAFRFNLSAGFQWAIGDAFRIKLGILTFFGGETPIYLPLGGLILRF